MPPLKEREREAIDQLAKPVDTVSEKWKLLPYFIKTRGVMKQHIDSFDNFCNIDIKNIVMAKSNVEIRSDHDENFYFRYLNIKVGKPSLDDHDHHNIYSPRPSSADCNPFQCRLRDCTYSAPLMVDFEYIVYKDVNKTLTAERKIERDFCIGRIPVMLRSANCVLRGKSDEELAKMKECAYDPGGYFVIKGVEKVILMQEQLSRNRVIIELDSKGCVSASITSATHDRKSRCSIFFRGNKVFMKHSSLGEEVPIVILLKAMGLECDQEIVQLIGTEPAVIDLLTASLEDAHKLKIYSRSEALRFLKGRIKKLRESSAIGVAKKRKKDGDDEMSDAEVVEVLAHNVLNHVPVEDYNFRSKVIYITNIVRRVLLTVLDDSLLDDKDYYGNKRLELAGSLVSLLFEDLFKRMNSDLKRQVDSNLQKNKMKAKRDVGISGPGRPIPGSSKRLPGWNCDAKSYIRRDTITQGFIHAISTGNWVLKRFRMDRAGVTQVLSRLSYISALGMMTRVNSQFEKTRKVSGPRSLQPSQWGMMCPADTPEGEACGLVKNLALLAHVTHDTDDQSAALTRLCYDLGVEDAELLSGDEIYREGSYVVIVNGLIVGAHAEPEWLVDYLRRIRRAGRMGEFVSIYLDKKHRTVNIASDGGRVCRPLLVVSDGAPLLTNAHMQALHRGKRDLQSLLRDGIIEYVDVNEENNCFVALHEAQVTVRHTHMEIDPLTILGVVAGLVPYPHHNQSPRNTYQCAMGKQAIGSTATNQYERMDSLLYTMVYPQKPMVTTKAIDLFNFNELPGGQNASLAVMSYSGYDIEDAIVLNRGSLDRGFGRCLVVRKYQTSLKDHKHEVQDRAERPPLPDPTDKQAERRFKRYSKLDADGIVQVGIPLCKDEVMVNKLTAVQAHAMSDSSAVAYHPTPLTYKGPEDAMVDKVIVTNNDTEGKTRVVKVLTRQCRRPEVGDKFSSRHGQKGVCGLIINQEDMPFSERGICPDLIMNPHGFPSRMTVGKMIELVSGKAAVHRFNEQGYGTAFGEASGSADKADDVCRQLVTHGYSYHGKDIMTSGITGEPIQSYVFTGPVFYQKLKHMVMDKMHSRAKGPRAQLTRQPTEGRSRDGGLRLGEMERDCLIGYGASNLITERLMISSDSFAAFVCEGCGLLGYENWCQKCRSGEKVSSIQLPYACKLLFQELQSMNIAPRLKLEDF